MSGTLVHELAGDYGGRMTRERDEAGAGIAGMTAAVVLGILLSVGILVVVLMIVTSNDDLDCSTKNAERATNGQHTRACD
jgi:hypothetical protein